MVSFPEFVRQRWPDLRGPGIVAVSGGADSVALLRTLASWGEPLTVAHLNHRLRGGDSDADEAFVRELAKSLDLPFRGTAISMAEEAQRAAANLEETARRIRYDWLANIAQIEASGWIATGHTADDQAETVLHRLIRGASIQGLRGIARERELRPGIRLVRPLLDVGRAAIIGYLDSIGQSWREDHTNRDLVFTRNRIRHELLPMLRTFNPAIGEVLGRLAEQASELHEEQVEACHQLLLEVERPRAGDRLILDAQRLAIALPQRIRGLFRLLWEREAWPLNDMTFEHWKRLVAVALGEETATDLPGGISARRREHVVQLWKAR